MLSQLYQSQSAGEKKFCIEGIHFGWKAIEDMFSREGWAYLNSINHKVLARRNFALRAFILVGRRLRICSQEKVGQIREGKRVLVPSLKPNFVFRDSWTRLNVRPAKIMQASVQLTTVIKV